MNPRPPVRVVPGGDGRSPVSRSAEGTIRVELGENHPGVADPVYRSRRDAIASLALSWEPTTPLPTVDYTDVEHATWSTVAQRLMPLWHDRATARFLNAAEELALPVERVPQLAEVTAGLARITGFRYLPVAGLAPLRTFYAAFGEGTFWSTQYLRHHSHPLYTPEPDLCHEVLGHANQLADPEFARLYRAVAATTTRVVTGDALAFLSKVFWFTLEFGVVRERGDLRAYGAGILSSFGELAEYRRAEVRPADWAQMGTQTYDITRYQGVLYEVPSMEWLFAELTRFLDGYNDDEYERLTRKTA